MNSIIDQLSMVAFYTLNFLNDLEIYESFLIWMHKIILKVISSQDMNKRTKAIWYKINYTCTIYHVEVPH